MGWESVPWAVLNGQVSPENARMLAYSAFAGNEGVMAATDLKVTQLGTPGASVQVSTGAAAIPCRSSAQLYQSYAGRMTSTDTVGIAATGGAIRYDLVVARVEDPWLAGEPWADPPVGDEDIGPYIFTRVISGVASSVIASFEAARAYLITNGYSAIPLAGITMPVSTSTVINSYINDLRRVANPRRQRNVYTVNPGSTVNLTSATVVDWFGSWSVYVPPWATRAIVTVSTGGVKIDRSSVSVNGTAVGSIRAILGTVATQAVAYDEFAPFADATKRISGIGAGDTINVTTLQGTTQTLRIQGLKSSGNKNLYVDTGSFAVVDVEFQEVAQ